MTKMTLTQQEIRVLGVLIEKAITTPDQYPLSLNALTLGCNQKTNRDPVTDFQESEVQNTLDSLIKKNLVSQVRIGTRVPKFQHRFSGTEFSVYRFNARETGILCLLFLRGPQTAGELRSRSGRLCEFSDVQQVEHTLQVLADYAGGPFVAQLEREPGRREHRFVQLFSDDVNAQTTAAQMQTDVGGSEPLTSDECSLEARVAQLEAALDSVQKELKALKQQLGED